MQHPASQPSSHYKPVPAQCSTACISTRPQSQPAWSSVGKSSTLHHHQQLANQMLPCSIKPAAAGDSADFHTVDSVDVASSRQVQIDDQHNRLRHMASWPWYSHSQAPLQHQLFTVKITDDEAKRILLLLSYPVFLLFQGSHVPVQARVVHCHAAGSPKLKCLHKTHTQAVISQCGMSSLGARMQ